MRLRRTGGCCLAGSTCGAPRCVAASACHGGRRDAARGAPRRQRCAGRRQTARCLSVTRLRWAAAGRGREAARRRGHQGGAREHRREHRGGQRQHAAVCGQPGSPGGGGGRRGRAPAAARRHQQCAPGTPLGALTLTRRDACRARVGMVLCPACELGHEAALCWWTRPAAPRTQPACAPALHEPHPLPMGCCSRIPDPLLQARTCSPSCRAPWTGACTMAICACRHVTSRAEQTTMVACTPELLALRRAPESCYRLDSCTAAV